MASPNVARAPSPAKCVHQNCPSRKSQLRLSARDPPNSSCDPECLSPKIWSAWLRRSYQSHRPAHWIGPRPQPSVVRVASFPIFFSLSPIPILHRRLRSQRHLLHRLSRSRRPATIPAASRALYGRSRSRFYGCRHECILQPRIPFRAAADDRTPERPLRPRQQ